MLTYTDRLKIEWCIMHKLSKLAISREIGCCLKTVYNELSLGRYPHERNGFIVWRYSADIAQQEHDRRATSKGCPNKLGSRWDFVSFIENQILTHKASPAAALARWRSISPDGFTVSLSTLYRYIASGLYFPSLTLAHLPESRHKRDYHHVRPSRAPKGKSIERRPSHISNRLEFGHWEMDTVVGKATGKRQIFLVMTERLTRFEVIRKLSDKTTKSVVSALNRLECEYNFRDTFKSITVDNGCEFQDCYGIEHDRRGRKRTSLFYCHPYCSCERGSNERMNRMIRRFYPKGQSLFGVTQSDCDALQAWLNDYPRKVLLWQTPQQLFDEYCNVSQSSVSSCKNT